MRPVFIALLAATVSSEAFASLEAPRDVHPPPTIFWMVTQAIPSPEIGVGGPGAAVGMRWQLTPLLYSFGMYRKLSPWRAFVVEPLTRVSGSIGLFVSPEYLNVPGRTDEWLVRGGVQATLPMLEKGEKLAFSFGAGVVLGAESSAEFEAGFTVAWGTLGLFFCYAPRVSLAPATVMLRVRWF